MKNKAVYTTAPVAGGRAGAVMIWAGAVMIWAGACSKKNYPTLDRWTDLLTSMVTYRDANVFYNSLNT